jgi:hypothetical protein
MSKDKQCADALNAPIANVVDGKGMEVRKVGTINGPAQNAVKVPSEKQHTK